MKNLGKILFFSLLTLVGLASCSESEEYSEYADWAHKNALYIDSIAAEAAANTSGQWNRYLATGLDNSVEWGNEYYIYCKTITRGTGTECPKSNYNVWLNYSGRLINGDIFDATYSGELQPEYEAPIKTKPVECVAGFSLALQEMVKGDIWEVFIPSNLGYGAIDYGEIKAGSTLFFTVNLVDFAPPTVND